MKKHQSIIQSHNLLSRHALRIWRIRASVALIVLFFLLGGTAVFSLTVALIGGIVGITLYLLMVLLYMPMLFRSCQYKVNEQNVEIQKGVLFRRKMHISFSKVQYCEIMQGPVQKLYGLCSLRLLTAGSFELMRDISLLDGHRIKNMTE